jgi:hypothetical protein
MATGEQYGKDEGNWLKVFTPNARCLSQDEIFRLPYGTKRLDKKKCISILEPPGQKRQFLSGVFL